MAITESELTISNQSYTNKDFDAVYTELLTLAKQISYRYDPTASNESDPFIVLLKLLAFATDKVNYQIDKNILERFMPSATQESSMRDLTSRLGYNMHYYIGSETQVIYKYKFPEDWEEGDITIPAYTSTVKSSIDNSITFIPLSDGRIDSGTGTSTAVSVIQGTYKTLSVLDNTNIQLENLDEYNRLFFPETMVALNGVFIAGGSISELFNTGWTRSDNLNSERYGSPVYFFGFDSSRGLPYIQFPDWISVIIGSGLTINYIVTQGSAGNVRARALDTVDFTVAEGSSYSASDIVVVNTNAAPNGAEPETIDEAYNGFKKTIGTFDTLVTCRDYANAIYNLLDDSGNNYVSNIQVADRRSDINYSLNMVEYDGNDITESEALNTNITPYDLCLYPFKPISMSTVTALSSIEAYRESFRLLADTRAIKNRLEDKKVLVHTYKTLQSEPPVASGDPPLDIFAIKNYYELNAIISTVQKVDTLEQASILTNVNGALATTFYSRNVDFGYEIPYDELLKCIENADTRIKSVSLFEPVQTPKALMCDGTEVSVANSSGTAVSDWFKVVAIKNVVSGKVALFDYDTAFTYTYDKNRNSGDNFDRIKRAVAITTQTNIGSIAANTTYTLGANEAIQFIAPSYVDYQIYPYGINYYLKLNNDTSYTNQMSIVSWNASTRDLIIRFTNSAGSSDVTIKAYQLTAGVISVVAGNDYSSFLSSANSLYCFTVLPEAGGSTYVYNFPVGANNCIPKDSEYQLAPGDELIFEYTEDEEEKFDVFTSTTMIDGRYVNIIKPNFDMYTTRYRETKRAAYPSGETSTSYTNPKDGIGHAYFMLSTNQEVATRELNSEVISQSRKFYWKLQDSDNTIQWEGIPVGQAIPDYYEYILKENEEIFYTDMNMTSLQEFGSGTRLQITPGLYGSISSWSCEIIQDVSIIVTDGLESFKSYFRTINADNNNTFIIEEQQIITLTTNDQIKNISTSAAVSISDNTFASITASNIQYRFEADESFLSLPNMTSASASWRARALLDINAGPDLPLTLDKAQSITVYYEDAPQTGVTYTAGVGTNWSFEFDTLCLIYGGVELPLKIIDIYSNVSYPLMYLYKIDSNVVDHVTSQDDSNYCRAVFDDATPEEPISTLTHLPLIQTTATSGKAKDVYVMCFVSGVAQAEGEEPAKKIWFTYAKNAAYTTAGSELLTPYNVESLTSEVVGTETRYYLPNGMTILKTNGIKDITFTADSGEISLILSLPRVSNGINSLLGLLSNDLAVPTSANTKKLTNFEFSILSKCGGYTGAFKKFYATSWIDTVKELELSKTCKLTDAQAFYDTNNIANKWTIPEIDFDTDVTTITIARSSQK